MTLDEAIEQFKYDAECNRADLDLSYAQDNEQVAEWLEELKAYRASVFSGDMTQEMLKEQYCKAIDDFVKLAKEHDFKYENDDISKSVIDIVEFFAELLKEGANNGTDNQ